MRVQGGRSRFRTRIIGYASLVLVLGWLAISFVMSRYTHYLVNSIETSPTDVIENFMNRLPSMTDVNQLLALGARLVDHEEPDLAILALLRAQALVPESRDVNYLLAWELYRTMDLGLVADLDQTERGELASRALAIAATIDPLHPGIRELQTVAEQLPKAAS